MTNAHKSKEPKKQAKIRLRILFITVGLMLAIGLPVWFFTTTIHRAELPIEEIHTLSGGLNDEINFKIPVYLDVSNSLQRLVPQTQTLIDEEIKKLYPQLQNVWSLEVRRGRGSEQDYVVKLNTTENESSFFVSPFGKETTLHLNEELMGRNLVDDFIMRVLLHEIFSEEMSSMNKLLTDSKEINGLIAPYSSNYHIVFSLFIEKGKQLTWDIDHTLEMFDPFLTALKDFANFTIDTQIQHFSELSITPMLENNNYYVLSDSDISTFVNYGEWNLISTDLAPTLNFIIFVPDSASYNKPLLIKDSDTNSFIVPQWGGVQILNKNLLKNNKLEKEELLPIMETFSSQLFQLIGIPNTPKSPYIRIDILKRFTIFKNLKESLKNLNSLIKLVTSLEQIAIPDFTLLHVVNTIDHIKKSFVSIANNDWNSGIEYSSKAAYESNNAFFEKGMIQQAYFPDEHKLAVYLPLLGPILSMVGLNFLRTVKNLRRKNDTAKKDI